MGIGGILQLQQWQGDHQLAQYWPARQGRHGAHGKLDQTGSQDEGFAIGHEDNTAQVPCIPSQMRHTWKPCRRYQEYLSPRVQMHAQQHPGHGFPVPGQPAGIDIPMRQDMLRVRNVSVEIKSPFTFTDSGQRIEQAGAPQYGDDAREQAQLLCWLPFSGSTGERQRRLTSKLVVMGRLSKHRRIELGTASPSKGEVHEQAIAPTQLTPPGRSCIVHSS